MGKAPPAVEPVISVALVSLGSLQLMGPPQWAQSWLVSFSVGTDDHSIFGLEGKGYTGSSAVHRLVTCD